MKNATLAAILNFLFIGLGYVYLGKKPLVGWLLTLGAGVLMRYEELRSGPAFSGVLSPHWIIDVSGITLLGIGTAIDAYRGAQQT